MDAEGAGCPYVVGSVITLHPNEWAEGKTLAAKILEVFGPFTLSCAMLVEVDSPTIKGKMVLKMYDRRFAIRLREQTAAAPWTPSHEAAYMQFVSDTDLFVDQEDGSVDIEKEATLHLLMLSLSSREYCAYKMLKKVQRIAVPEFIAGVTITSSNLKHNSHINRRFKIRGVLLQYIDGFPLTDVVANAPEDRIQGICADAVSMIDMTRSYGVLNRDICSKNFIVSKNDLDDQFQVFMIDFGICNFRQNYRTEEEWEIAVGMVDSEGMAAFEKSLSDSEYTD